MGTSFNPCLASTRLNFGLPPLLLAPQYANQEYKGISALLSGLAG